MLIRIFYTVVVVVLLESSCYSQGNVSPVELSALQELYVGTGGSLWVYSSRINGTEWNFNTANPNPCYPLWYGLKCNCVDDLCNIVSLILAETNLQGVLENSLGNLIQLEVLDLSSNYILGDIPEGLEALTSLTFFSLGNNLMEGTIPEYLYAFDLYEMRVATNRFHGTLSERVCNMSSLLTLDVSFNYLSGPLPDCIGQLNVSSFVIDSNNFNGSLPSFEPNLLRNLSILYVGINDFTGPLPSELFNESAHLKSFFGVDCYFTGTLPSITSPIVQLILADNYLSGDFIAMNDALLMVDMSGNRFDGSVHFNTSSQVIHLYLEENEFIGSAPTFNAQVQGYSIRDNVFTGSFNDGNVGMLDFLQFFSTSNNFISGTLPEVFNASRHLLLFDIGNNLISGTIPSVNSFILDGLLLNDNRLSGSLPVIASSMLYYYAQNNQLTGSINGFSTPSLLEYIDLSNNQLTGSIPNSLFQQSRETLVSFAASTNCFSGSLPTDICSVAHLIFVDLDGLGTASTCRKLLLPALPTFKSFVLKSPINGGIPECYFHIPTLQTLHVSGNAIAWSFPSGIKLNNSLTDLVLSHNRITGSIPKTVQHHSWTTLDLSYNKLSGVLDFDSYQSLNASLTLEVNRLSGVVPSRIINMSNINILSGNLFGCSFGRNQLPVNDPSYTIYQCGSNSFNQASIIWCSFYGATLVTIYVVLMLRANWQSFAEKVTEWSELFQRYFKQFEMTDESTDRRLHDFKLFVLTVRNYALWISCGLVTFVLPLYLVLTAYFKNTEVQYAWTASAAFLSGIIPAIVLLVVYLTFIVALFIVWFRATRQYDTSVDSRTNTKPTNWLQVALLSALILLNCVVMVIVNAVYVVIILHYNTLVIFFAQVSIAFFKLLWNEYAIRWMIVSVRSTLRHFNRGGGEDVETEMPYMTFIVLFNSIIAPCVATAVVDRNCFLNVFVPPSAVTSNFPIAKLAASENLVSVNNTVEIETKVTVNYQYMNVQYSPPFIYSYQCSSSILTNYATVYVFMFTIIAFVKPIALYMMLKGHKALPSGSCLRLFIDNAIYNLLKPAKESSLRKDKLLFHKERFVLRTVAKVAVFVTFGVVFPLLTIVICAAFITEAWVNLVIIGRFLANIEDLEMWARFREKLSDDSERCWDLLMVPLVRLVVPLASLFYAFFVFDIYGDKVGVERAIWGPIVLVCSPIVVFAVYQGFTKYCGSSSEKGKQRQLSRGFELKEATVNVLLP